MNYFELTGKIRYGESWAWVECPKDVGDYYRAVAKWIWGVKLNAPRNGLHITLVAGKYEKPLVPDIWGKREGELITFAYSGMVSVAPYWWLKIVEDSQLRAFRRELGLPEELKYAMHATVGRDRNYVGPAEEELTNLEMSD